MEKEYFAITNKLYQIKESSEWDYAVMAAIATFNYPFVTDDEKTTEIKIKPFKIDDVFNILNMSNKSRNKKVINVKIQQSLTKLLKEKVLSLIDVIKSDGRDNTFILKQNIDVKGEFTGFASITADEFFNITLRIEKDSEKIKSLACYTSIIQRIFKAAKRKKQANFNWESTLNHYVNWEKQETIGAKYGMSRKAVGKSIQLLSEVEAIATKAVKQKSSGKEVKYIYSKACDTDMLDAYVSEQIGKGEYVKVVKKKDKSIDVEEVVESETIIDDISLIEDKYEKIQQLASFNSDDVDDNGDNDDDGSMFFDQMSEIQKMAIQNGWKKKAVV